MAIPRKPSGKTKGVEDFIHSGGKKQYKPTVSEKKTGRKVISMSFMLSDADWMDEIVNKLNTRSTRKITRSEIVSAALGHLREKNLEEVMQVVKNR